MFCEDHQFCLIRSTATCSTSKPNCYSGQAVFNISSFLSITHKGCLATASCNTTSNASILGAGYTISQTCCSTNLCNGAGCRSHPTTSHVALGATLVAIWCTFS
ncbi:unnamed protein product [Coregonus sp. 'balchen']|nr:unnamed protein product [Coregonus sp. 'balchen']